MTQSLKYMESELKTQRDDSFVSPHGIEKVYGYMGKKYYGANRAAV